MLKKSLAGRARWVICFALLLLAVAAMPVFAAETPEGSEGSQSLSEIPAPSAEELAPIETEQRERTEWLSSPEAQEQREASLTAYTSLSTGEAKSLLVEAFPKQLEQLNADPARVLSELEVEKPLGTYSALVSEEGGETALLNSSSPVESELGGEGKQPVDLALEESGGAYVAQNPVTEVELPSSAEAPIQLEGGVGVELPASDDHAAEPLGEMNLFLPETEPTTDTFLAPRAGGLEIFEQLRSPESPERFTYNLNLPAGATLRPSEAGGAEVISSSGEQLEEVPPASATDAQGAAVPVTTSVEGDSLVLDVQHGSGEVAYPVLLDPSFINDTTSFGEWVPSLNSAYEYLLANNGSSLSAISRGNNYEYPAGTHGQWAYAAYGQTSYIGAAAFSPNYFMVHSCQTAEPHGYIGLYNPGSKEYDALGVYRNQSEGSTYETGWRGGTGTKDAVIGIGADSKIAIGCAHELYVGGYTIAEEDPEAPTVTSVGGVPSGWAKELTVTPHVSDPGLGVKAITLSPEGSNPEPRKQGCSGANGSRCPGSWETSFGGSYFAEGERSAAISAYDPLGPDVSSHVSSSYQFTTRVDRQKPELELEGEFTEALQEAKEEGEGKKAPALHLSVYNLKIKATDKANEGNPQTEAKARRSGVKNIKVFLDGKELKVPWSAQGCSGPTYSCPMSETFPVPLNEVQGGGVHKLKVVASDQVGNEREPQKEFEYFPATGIEGEYVMQHFPLPDGEGNEAEEEDPKRPELAVNVANGNLVFRQRDVEVSGPAVDLEVERFYNSQLPEEDNTEWGKGWTLAQTPKLEVEEAEAPAPKASMLRSSGALLTKIGLPSKGGASQFDKKLQALVTKVSGGYEVADASGETDTALHFDEAGKVTELSTFGAAKVNYSYAGGDLSEIAVEDPATFGEGATAAAEVPIAPNFIAAFGATGSEPGQLSGPRGLAADGSGHVWVVDRANNRIEEFTEAGEYLGKFGSSGTSNGQFSEPWGITVTPTGNLWVADTGNKRLQEFNSKGEFIQKFGTKGSGESKGTEFIRPEGITSAPGGMLWVADAGGHRIAEFRETVSSESERFVRNASGATLSEPISLAVDASGDVYAADEEANHVFEFSPTGGLLQTIGTKGSANGQLSGPTGLAVSPAGYVYVVDKGNNRVEAFSSGGQLLAKFGTPGTGNAQFSEPRAIAFGAGGALFVTDKGNNRVHKWGAAWLGPPAFVSGFGATGSEPGQLNGPRGLAADGSGHVWVVDRANNRIEEFNEAGKYLGQFGKKGTGNGEFTEPWGIAVTAAGNLWVTDSGNHRVQEFNSEGKFLQKFGTKASGESKGTELLIPEGIAATPDGMLWVTDSAGNRVAEFRETVSSESERFVRNAGGTSFKEPAGLAVDSFGNVWVAEEAANHLLEFSSEGSFIRSVGSTGSGNGQLNSPAGVGVGPSGYIYVSDLGNNRIEVFGPGGQFVTKFGAAGTGDGSFTEPKSIAFGSGGAIFVSDKGNNRIHRWGNASEGPPSFISAFGATGSGEGQLNGPRGLAADGKGHVWIVDRANNRVEEFTEEGQYIGKFGSSGTGDGQFSEPWGITVTAEGNLWVADTGNHRLEEFSSEGKFLQQFGSKPILGESKGTEFLAPEGIAAAPGGMLWVSDSAGHRLGEFRETTSFGVGRFVGNATGATLVNPVSLTVDASGDVYAADEEANHVFEFSSAGTYLQTFGTSKGSGNGQLSGPTGVALAPSGDIYVVDRNNNRVEVFNPAGEFRTKFGTAGTGNAQFSEPRAIAFGAGGSLFVTDKGNNRVHRWAWSASEEPLPPPASEADEAVQVKTSAGLVSSVAGEEAGTTTYTHSGQLLTAAKGPHGESGYAYDSQGRLTKVTLPNGTWGEVKYDAYGRVESVSVSVEGAKAKTTKFEYKTEPRRTTVSPEGEPASVYDIAPDGSVLKSWNTQVPPEIENLSGNLYTNRETAAPIGTGDYELLVQAFSNEGIASIQVIANENQLVDEKTCQKTAETTCKTVEDPWVTNTGNWPPGILQLEVIVTDSYGKTESARFWVNIPYTPPPDPEAEEPPTFEEVLRFREEFGLDLDLKGNEIAIDERIFNLIGDWYNPQTLAGEVARATAERWGVPLRAVDAAELEYRERYVETDVPLIEEWAESHRTGTYAGYYVNNRAGGTIYVGFTEDQSGGLSELEQQVPLFATERLATYPASPDESRSSLQAVLSEVETLWDTDPELSEAIVSTGIDETTNTVEVAGTNVALIDSRLKATLGTSAPIQVVYEEIGEDFAGRNHTDGRIHAGDRIIGTEFDGKITRACSAGFGAWEKIGQKPTGEPKIASFVLTAGHCARPQEYWYRSGYPGVEHIEESQRIGHSARTGLPLGGQEYETDGSAIRLNSGGLMPRYIYINGHHLKPVGSPVPGRHGEILCFSGVKTNRRKCGEMIGVRRRKSQSPGKQLFIIARFAGLHGDSGAPVWSPRTGDAIGLLSGGPNKPSVIKDWITPLVKPRGFPGSKVPGILNAPGMGSLNLAEPGK